MINLSKKVIASISAGSAVVVGGSTVLVNAALIKESGSSKQEDPLNRGKDYHYYSLINKMQTNAKFKDLIDYQKSDKQLIFYINENKFKETFKSIVQDTLKSIPTFSLNYLNYVIECSYKIKNTRSILVDLVWYEPGNKTKFYDQFQLCLLTN